MVLVLCWLSMALMCSQPSPLGAGTSRLELPWALWGKEVPRPNPDSAEGAAEP